MNERIKELTEQADNFADNKIQMPGEYHPDWHDVRDEKFALLIIRECRDIVGKTRDQAIEGEWNVDEAMSTAMFDIEDYFGVK